MAYNDLRWGLTGVHILHDYLVTQLPFPYVHMIILLVCMHNIVLASVAGLRFAIGLGRENYFSCFAEILQFIAVPLLYQALLQVCVLLSNPLGDDIIDFPILDYQTEVSEACQAMVDTTRDLYKQRWKDQLAPLPYAAVERGLPPVKPIQVGGEPPPKPEPKAPPPPASAPAPKAVPQAPKPSPPSEVKIMGAAANIFSEPLHLLNGYANQLDVMVAKLQGPYVPVKPQSALDGAYAPVSPEDLHPKTNGTRGPVYKPSAIGPNDP